jgi:hypothetical protein
MSLVSIQYIGIFKLNREFEYEPTSRSVSKTRWYFWGSRGGHDIVIVLRRSSRAAPSSRGYIEAMKGGGIETEERMIKAVGAGSAHANR